MGRFGTPEVVHTDRGTAFHNELVSELLRMTGTEQSLSTAYSSEENGIVERANQEVLRHLNAILFDTRVHDKWSFEQLPMVQRIMNTVEKTSTGVSPAELILNNSFRLTERILLPPTQAKSPGQFALSDIVDEWVARQCRSDPRAGICTMLGLGLGLGLQLLFINLPTQSRCYYYTLLLTCCA